MGHEPELTWSETNWKLKGSAEELNELVLSVPCQYGVRCLAAAGIVKFTPFLEFFKKISPP